MKIGIVTRKNETKWGGDLVALQSFYQGLKEIEQDVVLAPSVQNLLSTDFIFLSNTSFSLKEDYAILSAHKKRFGVFGFHADRSKYYSPCYGFAHFVGSCLAQKDGFSFFRLEQLLNDPDIIHHFPYTPPPMFEENYPILNAAEVCIATSETEANTMRRDSPGCNVQVVYLDCSIEHAIANSGNECFLQWSGLRKKEYILQVGRLEPRKNQLGTILATCDLDIPLVFIATETFYPHYEQLCLEAIRTWRKAPTFLITQNLSASFDDNLRILPMPQREKLSLEMLYSAYQHAGVYLHPAFCELPGLTCLEAARFGIPMIASEWMTLKDYFPPSPSSKASEDQIVYPLPHHISDITRHILQQFGREIHQDNIHPIFSRTKKQVGADLFKALI